MLCFLFLSVAQSHFDPFYRIPRLQRLHFATVSYSIGELELLNRADRVSHPWEKPRIPNQGGILVGTWSESGI